ncbi:MAG: hypothetical protein WC297_03660 [Candidatus Paceibacterota bacterium]|jgi:hypothetical protein
MKKLIFCLIFVIVGYILGSLFPYSGFIEEEKGIEGAAQVEVTLQAENNDPLANVEVDIAEIPGPPLSGGVAHTDENGTAVFQIKPGDYFIFFNSSNFPEGFIEPEPREVTIEEGELNEFTIVLELK